MTGNGVNRRRFLAFMGTSAVAVTLPHFPFFSIRKNRAKICVVKTLECPYEMSYDEFVMYTAQWVNWPRLDQFVRDSVKNGTMIAMDFKLRNKRAQTKMYFTSVESWESWRAQAEKSDFFYPETPTAYPATFEVVPLA